MVEPAWAVLVAGRVSAGRWRAPAEHLERAWALLSARPTTPSAGLHAAAGASGLELLVARAKGAEWIDDYLREWRHVRPAITGADLIAAGVEEGPAIGRGLAAAHAALLDGAAPDREAQLEIAVEAARGEA